MTHEELLSTMKAFDGEIYIRLQDEIQRQRLSVSLVPTMNAESPFVAYLEGSVLANDFLDYHALQEYDGFEELAAKRAANLFGAQHAVVRLNGTASASRVVFEALLSAGDSVLSFNGRKKAYSLGLQYDFHAFGINAATKELDVAEYERKVKEYQPKLVIVSPVNYPLAIDYRHLADVAHEAGAYFWVEMGQNAGLIAAGLMDSPVPYADIVTMPTSGSLHGPEGAMLLCTNKLAEVFDQAVVVHGYAGLQKNHLAALAVMLREARGEAFKNYCQQAINNATALGKSLQEHGIELLYPAKDSYLVMAKLPEDVDPDTIEEKLQQAGIFTKADVITPEGDAKPIYALRLSTLSVTTRSLKENDVELIGGCLSGAIKAPEGGKELADVRDMVGTLVMQKPIFSEEWITKADARLRYDGEGEPMAQVMTGAEKQHLMNNIFGKN